MKFLAKNNRYISKNQSFGIFENAYIKDVYRHLKKNYLKVDFALFCEKDKEVQIENESFKMSLIFNNVHQETIVHYTVEEEIFTEEITNYLQSGKNLENAVHIEFAMPSFQNSKKFFDLETVWEELQLSEELKIVSVPGLLELIKLEGRSIKESFEYVEE